MKDIDIHAIDRVRDRRLEPEKNIEKYRRAIDIHAIERER